MTHTLARLTTVGLAGALLTLGTTQVSGAADDAPQHTDAAPDTIVKVTGNADYGFGIEYYDGTSYFPPTLSEALTECREYSKRVGKVRCRKGVKVWYRDLADMKRAINHAHRS